METQNKLDLLTTEAEDYISLAAAAALIRIDGKRARPSTAFRWYQNGIGGRHGGPRVHLKALRLGGRIVTKTSWVREFLDHVAAAATPAAPSPLTAGLPKLTSNRSRQRLERAKRDAEKKAAAAGF
jgi:hypothetical protein